MTHARACFRCTLTTRSLWRTWATMLLSLAAAPAAAQNPLWIRQLGTSRGDSASAASPDGSGGVYLSGITVGSLAGPNAGHGDAWLARYDGGGNPLWIRQLGTNTYDHAYAAAPDGSGGVYMSGITLGSLGGPTGGSVDAWLARYDGAGNQLWILQFGTNTFDHALAAAPDGSGGVYIGGMTGGSLGGSNMGNSPDAWLARYDSGGTQLWIRQLGTNGIDEVSTAASDGLGGVYVSGITSESLGAPNVGGYDVWLARYDGIGNQLWVRQIGTSATDFGEAIAPDLSGGVYVSGSTSGSLGGSSAGGADVWLARYDGAGNQLWITQLGTSGSDFAYAAAPDGSGGMYVSGYTSGSLGGPQVGGTDAWVARYELPCPPISIYCSAKTNSAGCVPAIAATGNPSASAGSGFMIDTSNVLDNVLGLYFYSKSGPSNLPFHGGTLCAQQPLVRTMLQHSGGTAPCGGSFSIDFNAYVASGKDPALVAGQGVWAQTWSRDPAFAPPNDTSLSDAVSFTLCP